MKTHLMTGAIALLAAAAPATAQTTTPTTDQTAPGTMAPATTYPGMTYPGMTDTTPSSATGTTMGDQTSTRSAATTQPATTSDTGMARSSSGPKAPDGTPAFGFKPYFGILGGYELHDRPAPIDGVRQRRLDGAMIEGVAGFNIPLGAVFIGAEGHVARGFGDIRWEYGARGRAGFRAGDSGLIYASAGYTWTDVRQGRGFDNRKGWVWGLGAEFGPSDIGLGGVTGNAGPRIRISVETADFDSVRPMAGVVFHF
ncbi:MAG: opacity protein [Sphingomonadales bacterium]|jgi:opacity protein-like surface antigen